MIDITASIPASNYRVGRTKPIDTIVFHHIVGDAPAAIARFKTPGVEVSSTYIISSTGQVYLAVKEANTPYTNGYDWNPRSITIEHAGGTASVPYTEAMYKASIELCRAIMSRHKIVNFKRHREIMATACPGGLNVERIVKEAKLGGLVLEEQPPVFNAKYYLNKYPDVNAKYNILNAKEHWKASGIKEGRASAPNFHVKEYLANYGDLRTAFGATGYAKAVQHYFNNGINEKRSGRTIVPPAPAPVDKAAVLKYVNEKLT